MTGYKVTVERYGKIISLEEATEQESKFIHDRVHEIWLRGFNSYISARVTKSDMARGPK